MSHKRVTIAEMQELAKLHNIKVGKRKTEIWQSLSDYFEGEDWVDDVVKKRSAEANNQKALDTAGAVRENLVNQSDDSEDELSNSDEKVRRAAIEVEIQLLEERKRLMEIECDLQRREMQLLRREQETPVTETPISSSMVTPNTNIKMVAELVGEFDGNAESFEIWEKQLRLVKDAYNLSDDVAKILISMRLKGKAVEWFRSKAEHISLSFDNILVELRRMFCANVCKVETRKKFEKRSWKKGETFREYAHEKIILGNRVPVSDEEMLVYLIDGIHDKTLYYQARTHRFKQKEDLIEAFGELTLQDHKADQIGSATASSSSHKPEAKQLSSKAIKCFNCGNSGHISANCSTKNLGPKCFKCRKHGHLSTECTFKGGNRKNDTDDRVCSVAVLTPKKYTKIIKIGGHELQALIDTGSDLTLMRDDVHKKIGAPPLTKTQIRFTGIDSPTLDAIGEFETLMQLDSVVVPVVVRVVSKQWCNQKLIVGADVLAATNFTTKKGEIYFEDDDGGKDEENVDVLPEIFQIDVVDEQANDVPSLQHIQDDKIKSSIALAVEKYQPVNAVKTTVTMKLVLKDDEPVYQKARRLSSHERDIVNKQIDEWMKKGIVRPSSSDYASPVVLVKKRNGSHRLCVDYRKLNTKIVRDRYPLPHMEDQIDQLQGASIFSVIDLKDGFFHIDMSPESVRYTSFIVPDGQYEFLKAPFGLCNCPAVFQRYVNAIFRDAMREGIVVIYMDDILVISHNYDDGLERLKKVLMIASSAGLNINWKKCAFLCKRVEFIGHIIENGTVKPSDRKIKAVMNFPKPTTVRQVQSFLGLSGYFRKFVKGYATIAKPLSDMLRSTQKFNFGELEEQAFNALKTCLMNQPVLALFQVGAETELHTDASKQGYGAILLQRNSDDGTLHPVYYASGKTTEAEEKYSSYELEVLAVVKALRRFRVYLLGIKFKLVTDCKAFTMTMSKKDLCVRVARWALLLEEFHYVIEHRSGQKMRHVDALSRNPLPSALVVTEAESVFLKRIKKAQHEDDELQQKIIAAEKGTLPGFEIQRGILFKQVGDELRLVVPKPLQHQVIKKMHERGHLGISKTEILVSNEFWMPNLKQKVEKVVRNCLSCILAEQRVGKQPGFLHSIEKGSVPLDTYHIDHLGPLASTKKSYAHILVVIDAFSKFLWLYATKSTTSAEVVQHLKKQSTIFGNPRRIISDRGTAFSSKEFENYCCDEGIEHKMTTTGIARANGQVERVNRMLIPMLTKICAPNHTEWYRYLNDVQKIINSTPHSSTKHTPFNLMFGVDANLKNCQKVDEIMKDELIALFNQERDDLRDHARQAIAQAQERNKRSFNKGRAKPIVYKDGDIVAIKKTQKTPGSKFANKYLGPYEVIRVLRGDRYLVQKIGDGEGPKRTSTATDFMKLWTQGEEGDLPENLSEDESDVIKSDSRDDC